MWPGERHGCVADPLEVLGCAANAHREAEGCRCWCRSHTRQPFRRDIGSLHELKVDGDISRVGSKDRGGALGDTEFREDRPAPVRIAIAIDENRTKAFTDERGREDARGQSRDLLLPSDDVVGQRRIAPVQTSRWQVQLDVIERFASVHDLIRSGT